MTKQHRELLRLEVPFGVLGAALVISAATFAVFGIPAWIPPAPLVRLGIPSPLTGMTRSFVALASGDISTAFRWHPLGPVAFAVCAALPIIAIASWARGSRLEPVRRATRSGKLWAAVALSVGLVWTRQLAGWG